MIEARRHPIDYDAIQKGDTIPASDIERITETSRNDVRRYQFAILKLRERIESELAAIGKPYRLRQQGDNLYVLTDAEASAWAAACFQRHLNGMASEHRRTLEVDAAELTVQERKEHERSIIVQGKFLQAMKQVRREIRLAPHERITPGLPTMDAAEAPQ